MAHARMIAAWAPALAVVVALVACDAENNDWEQPVGPLPGGPPDLVLSVELDAGSDGVVRSGETVGLEVAVRNRGSQPARGIAVSVTAPSASVLAEATADSGRFDAAAMIWSMDGLASLDVARLTLELTIGEAQAGRELLVSALVEAMEPADPRTEDNVATVRFTVVNAPPYAGDDAFDVAEGGSLSEPAPGVLRNDEDPDHEALEAAIVPVAAPRHGTLMLATDGSFTYNHDGSEAAADSFRYRVVDASSEADTATVRLAVAPVNDAPVVTAPESYTAPEDAAFPPIALDDLVADPDDADEDLQWSIEDAVLRVDVDDDRVLRVTPRVANWYGTDIIELHVVDPGGETDMASVRFVVIPVNDPPVVDDLPSQTVRPGGAFAPIPLDLYVTDVDDADEDLVWTVKGGPPMDVTIGPDRVLRVVPPGDGWTGRVTLTLRATDPGESWSENTCEYAVETR